MEEKSPEEKPHRQRIKDLSEGGYRFECEECHESYLLVGQCACFRQRKKLRELEVDAPLT